MSDSEKITVRRGSITTMPVIPLRGAVIFPDTVNHFDIGREKSIKAVEIAQMDNSLIFLVTQRDIEVEDPGFDDLYTIGVVAEVKQTLRFSDSLEKVLVECKYRARLKNLYDDGGALWADIVRAPTKSLGEEDSKTADALVRNLREQLDKYFSLNPKFSHELI